MAFRIDQPARGGAPAFDIRNSPLIPKPAPNLGKGPVNPRSAAWAPMAPVRNAPRAASAPKRSSGGSGSFGGGSTLYSVDGGGDGGLSVSVPSEEDYLKGDASYQATLSALLKQLTNFNTDIDTQLSNRKLDYSNALEQLGYIAPSGEGVDPSWNYEDQTTAAGRAYQAMLNDYAARNMVQSSAYGEAQNDLSRTLNKQYEGLSTSNDQFVQDLTRQKTKAADENTAAQQAARAEAIMRRAAQYGFGV